MEKHIQQIFGIYDIDYGFRTLFNTESTTDALRGFAEMCKNNPTIKLYPEKFQLWKLGTVDSMGTIKNDVAVLENATTYAPAETEKTKPEA